MSVSSTLRELLFGALLSDHGIVVECPEPLRLRAKLYAERKKDFLYMELSFVLSPNDPQNELWIVKNKEPANAES